MSPSKDPSSTPKIAIKGFSFSSKSSSSTNSATKPKPTPPSSTLGKRPRPHTSHFHNADSDDDEAGKVKHEAVTGFGFEGAIKSGSGRREEKKELVIPRMGNRDWRAEARKAGGGGRNLLPPEVQAQRDGERRERENGGKGREEGVDVVNSKDGEIQWGLTVRKRVEVEAEDESVAKDLETNGDTEIQEEKVEAKPKTADEEALAALLGDNKSRKGPDLIIPTLTSEPKMSEESAYRLAVASAPDASTLEDYERIPVEEFGAAMLRGMGWKGEENSSDKAGKKGKEVKRRQNLLGLGAKELKDAEELGAWVQKSDVKRLKSGGGGGGRERRPGVGEYRREREERRYKEGGYREGERERERERERDRERDGRRDRDRRR